MCCPCLVSFLCREECYSALCVRPLNRLSTVFGCTGATVNRRVDIPINPRLHFFGSVLSLCCILINDFIFP